MTTASQLHLEGIRVGYPVPGGLYIAVDGVSLALQAGEIGSLLGPSGCGKTTVLRAIAGFEPLQAGRIRIAGAAVADGVRGLPPDKRRVGMMFQDYALFPHLDVAGNVAFGLRSDGRTARRRRVAEMLDLVGLAGHADAYPHELSGGQQQRVALARALAPGPALLLLDEPFSNLDADTRHRLAGELRQLLKATGTTVLMVTHDQAEAFAVADRIGVMCEGRLRQWDRAETLYLQPSDEFVGEFIGRGAVVDGGALGLEPGQRVLVRPEDIVPDPSGPICGELLAHAFRGPGHAAHVRLGDGTVVEIDLPHEPLPAIGATLGMRLVHERLIGFPGEQEPSAVHRG